MGIMVRGALVTAALAALCAAQTSADPKPALQLADLRQLVGVGTPQISPDGTRVVFARRTNDYKKDRAISDLVVVDVKTRAMHTLVPDIGPGSFEWSPDGTRIAYVGMSTDEKQPPQLYVLPMNGGAPVALTKEKNGVEDFDWRPDGRAIAYTAEPEARDAKAREHHEDAFDVTEEAWTEEKPTPQHQLYEIDAKPSAKPHHIGNGTWSVGGGFTYAANGKSVFVTRVARGAYPNQYGHREIIRVDIADGRTMAIPRLSRWQSDPLRSRDGRRIAFAFTNPRGPMQSELALADADISHPQWLTKSLDRNIYGASFMPDDSVVIQTNDATSRRFFRIMPGGRYTALALGNIDVNSAPSISRAGAIAFAGFTPDHPSELYVLQPGAHAPTQLTNVNAWIQHRAIGRHEAITWRTRDGLIADGVLTFPPRGAMRNLPLVLVIHGGPTSSSVTGFSAFADVLAAHGWLVFQPNYRGSDNLGLRFAQTTVPHIASVPGDDIEDGISTLLKRPGLVDTSRMAVSGWSEGGLMTSWLITHDMRWKAAVSGAAVNEWLGYDAMTDAKDFAPSFIAPDQWRSKELLNLFEDESPLTAASHVKTPTLILSDAGDYRVPTPLAYEFYHAVRATGTPVKFVIWPVAGHFPRDPVRSEDVYRQWEAWLVQHVL